MPDIARHVTLRHGPSETGLDYFVTRYFSEAQGRLTSGLQHSTLRGNMYLYARNNPLRYTDPTGMNNSTNGDYFMGGVRGGGLLEDVLIDSAIEHARETRACNRPPCNDKVTRAELSHAQHRTEYGVRTSGVFHI